MLSSSQSNAEESDFQSVIKQANIVPNANPRVLSKSSKDSINDFRSRELDLIGAKEKGISSSPEFSITEFVKPITISANDTLKHAKLPVSIEEVKGSNTTLAASNKQGKKLTIEEILGIPRQDTENASKEAHNLIRVPLITEVNKPTAVSKEHEESPHPPKLQKLYSKLGTRHSIFKKLPYPDIPVSYTHLTLPTNREV
eukprot:TRINITY_DN2971_c0_g3_i1.p1 TRINITY_DN2971_c0_g3~~TRINITY_DN2971_c0_g3_i1.p1  ORF type:complete len:199 (+),score=29.62 TRINITY_DN2971_c0_g3_i1:741-1337(+)